VAKKLDMVRAKKMEMLIREQGLNPYQAMIQAGYSPETAKNAHLPQKPEMREMIRQAQEDYLTRFRVAAAKAGLTPEFMAERLGKIVKKEGDTRMDFNSIAATKEIHRVMLNTNDKANNITVNGVFVIPEPSINDGWRGKVTQYEQAIEAERVEKKD
jgi:hypothetical protein